MIPLLIETWIWWGFIIIVTVCRMISRSLLVGSIKNLGVDDYLTLVAVGTYTALIVSINIVGKASSNLLPPGYDISTLTPEDIRDREYGSKLVLVVEQCQILTTWLIKACMLIMYARLTSRRKENFAIKLLGGYTAFSFVFMEIFYFGVWCRPFQNYWAVPTPNAQCSAATNHLITNAVFNISSDVLILCVALPMFIKTRLPMRKKIAIVGIFSLGSFVILCAILNKYYSFSQPFGSEWTYWYVRESSTAILTANVPYVWALMRRMFHFRSLDSTSGIRYGYSQTYTNNPTRTRTHLKTDKSRTYPEDIDMKNLVPDFEHQADGIHREIDIRVTEDHRSPSMLTGKDGISITTTSSWAETWAPRSTQATSIGGPDRPSPPMSEIAPLPKALTRQHSDDRNSL